MDKEKNEGQNMKNALAFVPLLAFVFYVIEKDRTERFEKNLKYAVILFAAYAIFSIFFGIILYYLFGLVVMLYFGFSFYLGYKAYNGEDVDIKFLNDIIDKINKK